MKKTVPSYSCVLPISKLKIEFRPILVKEEKFIGQINDLSDSFQHQIVSLCNLVNSCCEGKLESEKISIYDFQYLLMELRKKSVTETTQLKILCPYTGENVVVSVNFQEQPKNKKKFTDKKELLLNENIKLKMRTPRVIDLIKSKQSNYHYNKDLYSLISSCLTELETETESINLEMKSEQDKIEILESLTKENFETLKEFVVDSFLVLTLDYTTSDGEKREVIVGDFINFLRFYLVTLT